MSVQYVEQRVCDVCQTPFAAELQAWLTLSAPNLDSQEFDFCQWDCIYQWVTVQGDDEADQGADTEAVYENPVPEEAEPVVDRQRQAQAQAKLDAAMAQMAAKPQMTLAEAIMSGQLDGAMRGRGQ